MDSSFVSNAHVNMYIMQKKILYPPFSANPCVLLGRGRKGTRSVDRVWRIDRTTTVTNPAWTTFDLDDEIEAVGGGRRSTRQNGGCSHPVVKRKSVYLRKIRAGRGRGNGEHVVARYIYIGLERNEKAYFKSDRLTRWRLDFRAPRSNDDERALCQTDLTARKWPISTGSGGASLEIAWSWKLWFYAFAWLGNLPEIIFGQFLIGSFLGESRDRTLDFEER